MPSTVATTFMPEAKGSARTPFGPKLFLSKLLWFEIKLPKLSKMTFYCHSPNTTSIWVWSEQIMQCYQMPYSTILIWNSTFLRTRFSCKIVPFSDQTELQIVPQAFMMEIWFKVKKVDKHNCIVQNSTLRCKIVLNSDHFTWKGLNSDPSTTKSDHLATLIMVRTNHPPTQQQQFEAA
jgi:hypothetical protein